jgi:hypothetical protein
LPRGIEGVHAMNPQPTTVHPRPARLLLAMEPFDSGSLEIARALAAELRAELNALFVEDANLLRIAALPCTREIGRFSGVVRSLEPHDLERQMRTQADRLRESVSHAARELGLPWTFEVARGRLEDELVRAFVDADLAVFGRAPTRPAARAVGQPGARLMPGRVAASPPNGGLRVTVSCADAAECAGLLRFARTLAPGHPERITVLVQQGDDAESAVREMVRGWHGRPGHVPRIVAVPRAGAQALIAHAPSGNRGVVVLAASAVRDAGALAALIERVGCPVVLVA